MRRYTRRWIVAGGALLGFFGGLAACENTVQRQRAATCRRAVPAVAEAKEFRLLRVGTGALPDSVRVDYADGKRPHWVLCRFGLGTDLVGVTTDRETLTGAALYMLKRFYLDTPDAAVGDPGG